MEVDCGILPLGRGDGFFSDMQTPEAGSVAALQVCV